MPHDELDDETAFSPTVRERVRNLEIKYKFLYDDYMKTMADFEPRLRELKTFKDNERGRVGVYGLIITVVTGIVMIVIQKVF